jgi:hypothetical protein
MQYDRLWTPFPYALGDRQNFSDELALH